MWPWPHGEAMRSDARRAYFDRFRRDWRDFHDAMTRNVPAIEEDEARLMGKVDTSKWETPTMRVQADEWTIEMAVWTDEVSVWNYVDPSVDLWTRSSDLTSLEADKEEDECATGLLSMNDRELNGQERECAPKERVEVAVMKLDDQNVRTSCHVAQNDLTDDLPDAEQLSLHSHDADRKDACERTPDSPEVVTQPSSGSQDTLNRLTQHTQGAGVNGGSCLRELDLPHLQDPLCAKMGNSICEQAEEHLQVLFARFDELADLKSLLDEPSDLSHIFSATEQEGKSEINASLPSQQVIMPPTSQDGRHEELNDIRIRRVPFTGILRTRRPESVSKESVQVFKSVLRRNAAFTLMNTVPDNLDTQVSDMFRRAISSNGDFTKSETDTISDVRLAMLPSQITLADAARVERAHDHIKREAERVLQSIPPLPESLTSLSINMPSIWNVSWVREVFRQAIWLHVLMLVMTCDDKGEATPDKESTTIRVISSLKYRAALGSAHYSEFLRVHVACGGSPPTAGANTGNDKHDFIDGSLTAGRSIKKQKRNINEPILRAVRIISSPRLLEKDDLLDELCSEYAVSFVERDLQAPIDLLIDERNGVCIIDEETFTNENSMREATFSLAKLQVQFEAIWILVAFDTSAKHEDLLHAFYPALTNFRINVTTYTCPSIQDICRCIREIVEACAESALATHRTLPRMWFERPFLLDDESQLERFLASTKIVNNVAAQSLLHRLSLEDLMTKSFEELRIMAQGSVSSLQLELLYSLMQSRHGIGHCVDQMDQN
ncbi:hypothetical protein Poli38472_013531 [Pythium oligandrum]|uniref:Uncharacterized protein n=1 Tax=Pythium oligandrum TaxID=41045 RepID=A0A8K1C7M7_PYTOL|nr:hypothetical protein Poli38472_013531 [Pythium oligandrum]|eukprot:TMW58057.1 hypothetical protein Poli38472_013531 [Pythium oligandrum]